MVAGVATTDVKRKLAGPRCAGAGSARTVPSSIPMVAGSVQEPVTGCPLVHTAPIEVPPGGITHDQGSTAVQLSVIRAPVMASGQASASYVNTRLPVSPLAEPEEKLYVRPN